MTKTTYRVSGGTPFNDYQPGDEFEADLEPFLEENALERGWIEIVKGTAKNKAVKNDG